MTTAFPLTWPKEWSRTPSRKSSQFKTSLEGAIKNVEVALRHLASDSKIKVENMLVSSNYGLTNRNPADPGVAVYFSWDGISTCIAVDRYARIEENLQAIYHCIEAERTKLRHGGLNLVRAAFRGYAALPPPGAGAGADIWYKELAFPGDGVPPETLAQAEDNYKILARVYHPDKLGGSHEKMARLNEAIKVARRALS